MIGLKDIVHTLDLINRPYALYVNISDAEWIKNAVPDEVKDKLLLVETVYVEKGKCYLIDRKEAEMNYLGLEEQNERD